MGDRHLLAVEIGPVQEMIQAARKTRDLWFSSYLVSEVAKAAARAVAEVCGWEQLIFPAPEREDDLKPQSPLAVADVVLAIVPVGVAPADAAKAASQAVAKHWREYADQAYQAARGEVFLDRQVWNSQVNDVFECYAAWTPLAGDYRQARQRVMQLLLGRTMCRDFLPAAAYPGRPKSSLDGGRDSVLRANIRDQLAAHREIHLRLSPGEQLDCVGLTKRIGEGRQQYPSVARIAADPWIRGVAESPAAQGDFQQLLEACASLADQHIISRIDIERYPQFSAFPYEGAVLFANRHRELAEEAGFELSAGAQLPEEMRPLRESLMRLIHHPELRFGEPDPYLAVIVADGDRMGAALAQMTSAEDHRAFSQRLSQFAARAGKSVREHHGALVYAGGDDVLAFVPVDRVVDCARTLHTGFGELLAAGQVAPAAHPLTLSVGVGIGHFLEPLEDLLDRAWMAEGAAKRGSNDDHRNGLALLMRPRGGSPLLRRQQWGPTHDDSSLDRRMQRWVQLLQSDALPDNAAYALLDLSRDYEPAAWPSADVLRRAMQADVSRLLSGKAGSGVAVIAELVENVQDVEDLRNLSIEILIARRLATSIAQATPR